MDATSGQPLKIAAMIGATGVTQFWVKSRRRIGAYIGPLSANRRLCLVSRHGAFVIGGCFHVPSSASSLGQHREDFGLVSVRLCALSRRLRMPRCRILRPEGARHRVGRSGARSQGRRYRRQDCQQDCQMELPLSACSPGCSVAAAASEDLS
jgi:hypothetical protein